MVAPLRNIIDQALSSGWRLPAGFDDLVYRGGAGPLQMQTLPWTGGDAGLGMDPLAGFGGFSEWSGLQPMPALRQGGALTAALFGLQQQEAGGQPAKTGRRLSEALFGPKAVTGGGASGVAAAGSSPTYATDGPLPPGVKASVIQWLPQVQAVAAKYGVPLEMALAVMSNESGGDPKATSAYNPGQGTAKGLFQTLDLHYQPGEDPYDPATNMDKGLRFLGDMYKRYGTPEKAMAAYFGGPSAIDAQGNIIRNRRDVNISIGDYVDKKFTPALAAYKQYLSANTVAGAVAPAAPTPQAESALGAAAIAEARKYIGMPYLLAGQANNPRAGAFDCSGLVQWSFGQAGKALPRVAQAQYDATRRIQAGEARPGDLVFFTGTYNAGTPVTHVGIYLGGNKMLQAGSSGVGYADLTTPYWRSKLYGWGRVA